jgi:RNA polymerase sigma-70 factor (ECF subfamily)
MTQLATAPDVKAEEKLDEGEGHAEWVRRAAAGEEEAREALYRWAFPALHRYLFTRLGEAEVTADLSADVFVAAFRELGKLERPGAFWPWLLRIAQCRLADHRRRSARERKATGVLTEQAGAERGSAPGPDAQLEAADAREALRQAFVRLAPDHQDALRLCVVEGLSHAEAGQRLGRSEKAVESLVARAREALRRELRKREPAFDPGL